MAVVGSGMEAVSCAYRLRQSLPKSSRVVYLALDNATYGPYAPLPTKALERVRKTEDSKPLPVNPDRVPMSLTVKMDANLLAVASKLKQSIVKRSAPFTVVQDDMAIARTGGFEGDVDEEDGTKQYTGLNLKAGLQTVADVLDATNLKPMSLKDL